MNTRLTRALRWSLTLLSLTVLLTDPASAEVSWEGDWPAEETVSLSLDGATRKEAIRELAEEVGWDFVVSDLDTGSIELQVRDQPTKLVLGQLLSEGDFVATRRGKFVSIRPATTGGPSEPTSGQEEWQGSGAQALSSREQDPAGSKQAKQKQARPKKGEDLVVTESAVIGPEDVVRDLFVWGGDVVVHGTVTRDIGVFGGSATFLDGSYVGGDVFGAGSTIEIENGADVDGEVAVLGGALHRGDQVSVNCTTCGDPKPEEDKLESYLEKVAGSLAEVSLLWVIGAILLAASLGRATMIREELTRRPLRSLGVGALGLIGLLVVIVTLVVTLIGIPLALLTGITAAVLSYLGVCLVMFTAGSLLLRGDSRNPYLQLALGCGAYFLLRIVPVAGSIGGFLVLLLGIGALISTRLGGFLKRDDPRLIEPLTKEGEA